MSQVAGIRSEYLTVHVLKRSSELIERRIEADYLSTYRELADHARSGDKLLDNSPLKKCATGSASALFVTGVGTKISTGRASGTH